MEVAIDCSCGIRYKFDVEPVNGQMPCSIQCPECSADGTVAANAYIASQPASEPGATPPSALRIQRPSAEMVAPEPPSRLQATASSSKTKRKREYGEPNFLLGSVGAIVAGFVAMMVWFFVIKVTNYEIGIIAWGVGITVGFACRTLGGGYSQSLGIVAALCALVAIIGGQYLATKAYFDEAVEPFIAGAYDERMGYAQRAVQLRLDNDREIRDFLAREWSDEEEQFTPDSFSAEDIQIFREEEVPALQAFIEGTPTRSEFEAEIRKAIGSVETKGEILMASLSFWTLLWLVLGVGSAYRLGTGETE